MFPASVSRPRRDAGGLQGGAAGGADPVAAAAVRASPLTSVRSIEDLNRGNFWGWPTETSARRELRRGVHDLADGQFILNSLLITIPAVAGTLALSTHGRLRARRVPFPRQPRCCSSLFIAGNFVPFQILMIPVRDLMTDTLGLYDTTLGR